MEDLRVEQKTEAVNRMKAIGIASHVIRDYEENGTVFLSEDGETQRRLDRNEQEMVNDFEKENQALVYHILKTSTVLGAIYSLLFVSRYPYDWKSDREDLGEGEALACVINADMPCREMGAIGFRLSNGCVQRTF